MSAKNKFINTDHLVIGTGAAGLMLALKLAKKEKVILISKSSLENNNSRHAQGGIASVLAGWDDSQFHIEDTLAAGAGLCHSQIVDKIVKGGPKVIKELVDLGVPFTPFEDKSGTKKDGYPFHLTKEGGHSKRRVIHVNDMTGKALVDCLIQQVVNHPNIAIQLDSMAVDLITTDKISPNFKDNVCLGAYILNKNNSSISQIISKYTYLCTGGCGKAYLYTSNPDGATGDGVAIGWRAGCKVANMEFMQFHPTCLYHPKKKNFLITEALRGEGAQLLDFNKTSFMENYHKDSSLAPRDIVARAIDDTLKRSGSPHVYLDCRSINSAKLKSHFTNIYQTLLELEIDITKDLIPVVPAAHYSCGGILVDENGETTVKQLFAVGEAACTGLHGANRLASNSLLEALVYGDIVSQHVLNNRSEIDNQTIDIEIPSWQSQDTVTSDELVVLSHTWDEIRRLMWNYVGIVRSRKRLQRAIERIKLIREELQTYYWDYKITGNFLEVRNLSDVAYLTILCAKKRKESRGIHFNIDYPNMIKPKDTIVY